MANSAKRILSKIRGRKKELVLRNNPWTAKGLSDDSLEHHDHLGKWLPYPHRIHIKELNQGCFPRACHPTKPRVCPFSRNEYPSVFLIFKGKAVNGVLKRPFSIPSEDILGSLQVIPETKILNPGD